MAEPAEPWFWPPKEKTEEELEQEEEEEEEDDGLENHERLPMVVRYLREAYFFCTWCGTKFKDVQDMEANCPGDTRDAHDE